VIYVDTSVALAHLFSESRRPPESLWGQDVVSSRLLVYEAWTVLHARRAGAEVAGTLDSLLEHLLFLELAPPVLARALEPFPRPLRTLDALHLASFEYLAGQGGRDVRFATYDARQADVARELGFRLLEV
jgi:predicted nucleic acid-binding protein